MTIEQKIDSLRNLMKQNNINTYIITKSDPHQSEYCPDFWQSPKFISGFSGSNANVVVTGDRAILWTDGRYKIQAKNQLEGTPIELFCTSDPDVAGCFDWCVQNTSQGGTIGFDGRTVSSAEIDKINMQISVKKINLVTNLDLVNELWENRPSLPLDKIFVHDLKYCGISRKEKLNIVRAKMTEKGSQNYLLTSLDDIAWLFNLRGRDIIYNMVFCSYAVITETEAMLFIQPEKLTGEIISELISDNISIRHYTEVTDILSGLPSGSTLLLNPNRTSYSVYSSVNSSVKIGKDETDITTALKSQKNKTEIQNIKNVMIKDGVAMVKFLIWLKENCADVDEYIVGEQLNKLREQQENFIQPSFDTIAAYMENGAMMHYSAAKDKNKKLLKSGAILVDSGGQYLDGTTDITRTIVLGEITDEFKRDFTYVLKSHIALATASFLYGTTGVQLDILARMPMWQNGMDYKSGTGHGIGFCLGVHEGPQNISTRLNGTKLEEGMLITNEPGVYKENKYGIRTENVMLVEKSIKTPDGQFMRFETISYCPIDLDAIDISLLTDFEKSWLNNYHANVYEKLSPSLSSNDKAILKNLTRQI